MCSSMLFVVQSTMVTASMVRGSAPSPITTSLVRTRSWAAAGAGGTSGRIAARDSTASQRNGRMGPSLHAELGVEGVAEPVADEVHAQRGESQGGAGEGGQPPGHVEEVPALGQHA